MNLSRIIWGASVSLLVFSSPAIAQQAQALAPAMQSGSAAGESGVQDIVVTAQRREQKLQDVPLAISAFNAETLTNANVTAADDLAKLTPSLTMTQASGTVVPFLRGIGSSSVGQGIESNTAMYVDGIYYPRLSPIYFQFNNVERVEILKGPQGTLFGRNAVGGVIHIITRDPGDVQEYHVAAGYSNYDTVTGNLYAATPLADGIALDLAVLYSHQGNGWGRNVTTGAEYGYGRDLSIRSKLVLKPTGTTKVKIVGDYVRSSTTIGAPGTGYRGTTQGNLLPPPQLYRPEDIGFYDVRGDVDNKIGGWSWGLAGRIDQEFSFADFVSLTSYRKAHDVFRFDGDYTAQPAIEFHIPAARRQFSQEFQLLSKPGSSFDWILGLYHLYLDTKHNPASFSGAAFGGKTQFIYGELETKSNAAFAQTTFHLGDRTDATVGLRYTHDRVSNRGHIDIQMPDGTLTTVTPVDQGSTFDKLTYKAALDHHFSDTIMAYASYSRGFRSGTYRITPTVAGPPARPEVLDAYEIGVKSELFDRKLRLNAAIFLYDINDPQVPRYPGGSGTVLYINAGGARVKGIDLEGQARVTRAFTLLFGATVLDTEYTDFAGAPFIYPNPNPPYGNGPSINGDATGNQIPHSPKLSFNLGFNWDIQSAVGKWTASGNWYYNSGFKWDPDNRLKQRPYHLVDLGLGLRPRGLEQWQVRLFVKNLANEKYYLQENEVAGPNGSPSAPAPPRTYGVSLSFDL